MWRSLYWTARRGWLNAYGAVKTGLLKTVGGSDLSRWAHIKNYPLEWAERTNLLAEWIPARSRVLEFGAGRQVLRDRLPEGCTYLPADLVKRNAETLIYDLNRRPFSPLPECDVVVLSGVLEYLNDLDQVAAHLATLCSRVVTSYAAIDIPQNARRVDRRAAGWFNDFTGDEVRAIFERNGFETTASRNWSSQVLFCFETRGGKSTVA